ncbi:MAG: DUF4382 domain-containing protein [Planctomycetota bacterium]
MYRNLELVRLSFLRLAASRSLVRVGAVLGGLLLSSQSTTAQANQPENLHVYLEEAPGSTSIYDRIYLTIDRVSVETVEGERRSVALEGGNPTTIDLLALPETGLLLAADRLGRGPYKNLLLHIESCEVIDGGVTVPVQEPLGPVVITCPFTITSRSHDRASSAKRHSRALVVDFDVEKSIVEESPGVLLLVPVTDVETDEKIFDLSVHFEHAQVKNAALSPSGGVLVALDKNKGSVHFIDPDTGKLTDTLSVPKGESEMVFKPDGSALLVAGTGSAADPGNTVTVISMSDLSAVAVPVGERPWRLSFHPDGTTAYVLNRGGYTPDNRVTVLDVSDPKNPQVPATITVGNAPLSVAFSDDGARAVVTTLVDRTVHVIDAAAHGTLANLTGPTSPSDVVFLPSQRVAVVADAGPGAAVTLIDTDTYAMTPCSMPAHVTHLQASPSGGKLFGMDATRGRLLMLASDGSYLGDRYLAYLPFEDGDLYPDSRSRPMVAASTPSGPRLFVAGPMGILASFDAQSGRGLGHLVFSDEIVSVSYNDAEERLIVTAGNDVLVVDPTAIFFGLRDPDRDYGVVEGPGHGESDETPVDVGEGNFGDLVVLVDDGLNSELSSFALQACDAESGDPLLLSDRSIWLPAMVNVVKAFYEKVPDIFDYLVVFYSSEWRDRTDEGGNPIHIEEIGCGAYHAWVRNFTRGLGLAERERMGILTLDPDDPSFKTSRLQSLVYMNDLGEVDLDGTTGSRERQAIHILAHELAHRFGAFIDMTFAPPGEELPDGHSLDSLGCHWDREYADPNAASVLAGVMGNMIGTQYELPDRPDWYRFQILDVEANFSDSDRYVLGYAPPWWTLPNEARCIVGAQRVAGEDRERLPPWIPYDVGDYLEGKLVDTSDIVPGGLRIPEYALAQHDFRIGLCIVVPAPQGGGTATVRQGDLDEVRGLRSELDWFWWSETYGEGSVPGRLLYTGTESGHVQDELIDLTGHELRYGVSLYAGSKLLLTDAASSRLLEVNSIPDSPTYGTITRELTLPAGTLAQISAEEKERPQCFVVDSENAVIRVVDSYNMSYTGDIALPAKPVEGPRVAVGSLGPAKDKAFVATEAGIVVIDLIAQQVTETITVPQRINDLDLTADGEVLVYSHGASAKIYWTNWQLFPPRELKRAFPLEQLGGTGFPSGIALDLAGGKMYWTERESSNSIKRANLDGSNVETVVTCDRPLRLALDLDAGKVYWTEWNLGLICRANLDGTGVENLVSGLSMPNGIALAVNLPTPKIYWTDSEAHKVQRADLDGSNVEDLVTGLGYPEGIAYDYLYIYFTDYDEEKIYQMELDGSGLCDLSPEGLVGPRDIALDLSVYGPKMYFTEDAGWEEGPDAIRRANLYDGSNVEDILTLPEDNPRAIAIDTTSVGQSITARSVATGEEVSYAGTYRHLAVLQSTANSNHSLDRAYASTTPPALVYAVRASSPFSPPDKIEVFDLTTNPEATGGEPRFEFTPLGVPDIDLPLWADDVVFSRSGELAFTACQVGTSINVVVINTATHEWLELFSIEEAPGVFGQFPELIVSQDCERAYITRYGGQVSVIR